jgi:hypothetical protein
MPQDTTAKSGVLPPGVHVIGRAVGDFSLRAGVSAKNGRPFQFVEGKILAGTTFVKINESVDVGVAPYLPRDGEEVRAAVVPNYKANGILAIDVRLNRPDAVTVAK